MTPKFMLRTKIILLIISAIATLICFITKMDWAGWVAAFTFVLWFMLYKMKPEIHDIPEPTEYHEDWVNIDKGMHLN